LYGAELSGVLYFGVDCMSRIVYAILNQNLSRITKMILKPTPISSDLFDYEEGTFFAEVSCLGDPAWERVYDDACDEGFSVVSAKTGKHVVFAEVGQIEEYGELAGWNFSCVTPGFKHLKAVVWND